MQYFPSKIFPLKHGMELGVAYEGRDLPDASCIAWSEIKDVKYGDRVQ